MQTAPGGEAAVEEAHAEEHDAHARDDVRQHSPELPERARCQRAGSCEGCDASVSHKNAGRAVQGEGGLCNLTASAIGC